MPVGQFLQQNEGYWSGAVLGPDTDANAIREAGVIKGTRAMIVYKVADSSPASSA
jgi:hypothetical protein